MMYWKLPDVELACRGSATPSALKIELIESGPGELCANARLAVANRQPNRNFVLMLTFLASLAFHAML